MIPLDELLTPSADRMPAVLARFHADRNAIERRYPNTLSPHRHDRLTAFFSAWIAALEAMPFAEFTRADRLDWLLFRNLLVRETERLARSAAEFAEVEALVPFALDLVALDDARRDHVEVDAPLAAARLDSARKSVPSVAADLKPTIAYRVAELVGRVKAMVSEWFTFYDGYDPVFSWWCQSPCDALLKALDAYITALKPTDTAQIVGDPVGREALLAELAANFIPYTPEELIAKAEVDRQWCLAELEKAATELGLPSGRAAIEHVKSLNEAPGAQPGFIRDLTVEAITFVEERDLLTIPELARDGWRMVMMPAERQKTSPFFLGGETIYVSYPTNTMTHDEKLMSQRGNNRHFARATVQHELIPGHYMQSFAQERYRPYRRLFWSPFWVEGWTLHWEFLLWELGFPTTPEEKVGMLFWRLHRCARVLFSLKFHLGEMTADECVALLVDEVGHEPENAAAEVRRSFQGGYDCLYQAAYLLGGMQVHALHAELLASGWTQKQFHDAFLKENLMPIPALRAYLTDAPLEKDTDLLWRF